MNPLSRLVVRLGTLTHLSSKSDTTYDGKLAVFNPGLIGSMICPNDPGRVQSYKIRRQILVRRALAGQHLQSASTMPRVRFSRPFFVKFVAAVRA